MHLKQIEDKIITNNKRKLIEFFEEQIEHSSNIIEFNQQQFESTDNQIKHMNDIYHIIDESYTNVKDPEVEIEGEIYRDRYRNLEFSINHILYNYE